MMTEILHSVPLIWWAAPLSAIISLITAAILAASVLKEPEGNDRMKEIAGHIKVGAMAYLSRQYRVVGVVFVVIFCVLSALAYKGIQSPFAAFAFLSGGLWSAFSGYVGMRIATSASSRTAAACQDSLNKGLKVSFRAGAVMGLTVVGCGLLDISLWYASLNYVFNHNLFGMAAVVMEKMDIATWSAAVATNATFKAMAQMEIATILITYVMGAAVMALFARVGGGIFTKAADVGADLVGKVEAGIPEDDPRNPATIADNVGDNVGDVAGMGADLYDSYCGSILSTAALGASLAMAGHVTGNPANYVVMPMVIAGGGTLASIIGIFFVRTKEGASKRDLLKSLFFGTTISSLLIVAFTYFLAKFGYLSYGIFAAIITGLVAGLLISLITEYYTSDHYHPTKKIAENSLGGPATLILRGLSTGMLSTGYPVVIIAIAIILAFRFSGGNDSLAMGIYGIGFAALGMLSTLGITLATDAFGPIADNAGGNAEMSGLPKEVRERTDALDAVGNTTAATGKGFSMGSAAFTVLALMAAYLETTREWISRFAGKGIYMVGKVGFTNSVEQVKEGVYLISTLKLEQLVMLLGVSIISPRFLIGVFLGSMSAFVFSGMTMQAVGVAAGNMVEEVRRQFREIKGILEGTAQPDYARCVDISTAGAQKAMMLPSIFIILLPIVAGFFFGIPGVTGVLIGALSTSFCLALVLNNAGGAWDNAKKNIEAGAHGGKGTDAHKAAVIGDTVGDPFKDTSGPSLNILTKLVTIVSIVFAGLILSMKLFI